MARDSLLKPKHRSFGDRALILAFLAVGCFLRITGLEVHSLWFDEIHSIYLASAPDLCEALKQDRHPPLSFLAFRFWSGIFGHTDSTFRALSASVSLLSLAIFSRVAFRLLPKQYAFAIGLYAVSPFHVWHAQEVRMYSFLELGALLAIAGGVRFIRHPGLPNAGLLLIGQALAVGSHYMGVLVWPVALAFALLARAYERLTNRNALVVVGATTLGILLWLPWVVLIVPDQLEAPWGYTARLGVREILELPVRLVLVELSAVPRNYLWLVAILASLLSLACLLYFIGIARAMLSGNSTLEQLLSGSVLVLPIAAALALTQFGPQSFVPRYLVAASPGAALVIAQGCAFVPWKGLRTFLSTGAVLGSLCLTLSHRSQNLREDFRGACTEVEQNWQAGDSVLCITGTPKPYSQAALRHYLRDRPRILESIVDLEGVRQTDDAPLDPGRRLHVVYRDAPYSRSGLEVIRTAFELDVSGVRRFRVRYLRFR